MNDKVTYHQQFSYCGKPHCRKCRDGIGHGPYWYGYQTIDGRTTRSYVGKQLPADLQAEREQALLANTPPALRDGEQAQTKQARIRIYSLGQMRLERYVNSEWQTVTDASWQHQRVRTLFSCLISTPARKLGREQLMGAVWPDLDSETASHRLDRAVYSLRQIFEPERNKLATSPLLLTERELLVLADHPLIWLDTDAFEHLIDQAHKNDNPEESERLLEAAATLYGGDFLPEEQELEWTLTRREKLQRLWIGLLTDLADIRITRNVLSNAIDPLNRLLSIDSMNESAVQRLMRVLMQLDRRGEALRAYKSLANALHREYNIAPLPETRAIYEAVRQDAKGRSTTISNASTTARSDTNNRSTAERPTDSRTPHEPAIQIGRAHQSPLVGREQELEFLRNLIATTGAAAKFKLPGQKRTDVTPYDMRRRPQSVLLMGDVGIGKTRLAEEMSREARKRGWAIAWSRVYAQESSIPYRLWIEVLRKAMEQSRYAGTTLATTNTPTVQIALPPHIAQRPRFYQPLSTLLPELHSILPDTPSSAIPLPEQEQHHLWEAARELLISISEGIPLLIVLDDLQWADASSCELLAYLARHIQGYPIIIIGTCRDSELTANSPLRPLMVDLQREYALETLSLSPLSDEQISILVSSILTRGQSADTNTPSEAGKADASDTATPSSATSMSASIQTRAAGNPFFAEELARTLATLSASAALPATVSIANSINTSGSHRLNRQNGSQNALPILPETITAVLDLRMNRLSKACRRLLSKAAVLGGSFEFPIISAMEANTPGSDEDTILELIEEALHMGMLTEEGIGTRITYQFWHPLLASHLYESLSAARRASLHRRAAEVLLHAFTSREEEAAATIVHHLVNGGADADQIAHYAELAGDRAYALSAYPDAEKHYRLTLSYLSQHPDEQLHRADISELLGECIKIQGRYEEARHFYEQALDILSSKRTTSQDQQREAQLQALLWCEIGLARFTAGDNIHAQQCYEHGEQILQEANVVMGPAWARLRYEQSYAYWREGNYTEAQVKANEALELFEHHLKQQKSSIEQVSRPTRIRQTLAGDAVDLGRVHTLIGIIAASGGLAKEALLHLNTSIALYEQYNRQRELAIACCNLGDVYLRIAQYSHAQAILRQSLSITERIGDMPDMSYAIGNMGILDIRIGNLADAENELRRGITLSERIDDPASLSIWHTYLGIVLKEQGNLVDAQKIQIKALKIGRATPIPSIIGPALVAIGNLRLTQLAHIEIENKTDTQSLYKPKNHLLQRAKKTLRHALSYEGMETETRIEGQLALTQALSFSGETQSAYQLAQQTLEEAQKLDLEWLVACTQRILGSILVVKGEFEQAAKSFELAIKTLKRCGMRLEYARARQHYGHLLIQQEPPESKAYKRGLAYLQEAKQIFSTSQAQIDLQSLERILPLLEVT